MKKTVWFVQVAWFTQCLLLLITAGCHNAHPEKIVGTWQGKLNWHEKLVALDGSEDRIFIKQVIFNFAANHTFQVTFEKTAGSPPSISGQHFGTWKTTNQTPGQLILRLKTTVGEEEFDDKVVVRFLTENHIHLEYENHDRRMPFLNLKRQSTE